MPFAGCMSEKVSISTLWAKGPPHRATDYDAIVDRRTPLIDVRLVNHPVESAPVEPFPTLAGAECVFLGRTRSEKHDKHGELSMLQYEAHVPLAENQLRELAKDAIDRFGCITVRIHHAIGEVPLGKASVLVHVVCIHRDGAFDACRFLIDQLKATVPIWKREIWADGKTWSGGSSVVVKEDE